MGVLCGSAWRALGLQVEEQRVITCTETREDDHQSVRMRMFTHRSVTEGRGRQLVMEDHVRSRGRKSRVATRATKSFTA